MYFRDFSAVRLASKDDASNRDFGGGREEHCLLALILNLMVRSTYVHVIYQ